MKTAIQNINIIPSAQLIYKVTPWMARLAVRPTLHWLNHHPHPHPYYAGGAWRQGQQGIKITYSHKSDMNLKKVRKMIDCI